MYGLVREGGGTKGAYHLGVLEAVSELNIEISDVVGTSIGAVNGALFAQGDFDILSDIWREISMYKIFEIPEDIKEKKQMLDRRNLSSVVNEIIKRKGLDISPFEKILRDVIDEDKLRRGKIDFGLVTYCLTSNEGKHMFLRDIPPGQLHDFILASCSFPGFRIRNVEDKVYIDGGMVNNLPVNMLVEKGIKNIISVEVGGFGISKKVSAAGCNLFTVRCGERLVGLLDFNQKSIENARMRGYLDAMKVFGRLSGSLYFFDTGEYFYFRKKYSENIMNGLEKAAEFFGIEKNRKYSVEEFIKIVNKHFYTEKKRDDIMQILKWSNSEKIAGLAKAIISSDSVILNSKIIADLLGDIFDAASSIAYFNMQNIQ